MPCEHLGPLPFYGHLNWYLGKKVRALELVLEEAHRRVCLQIIVNSHGLPTHDLNVQKDGRLGPLLVLVHPSVDFSRGVHPHKPRGLAPRARDHVVHDLFYEDVALWGVQQVVARLPLGVLQIKILGAVRDAVHGANFRVKDVFVLLVVGHVSL